MNRKPRTSDKLSVEGQRLYALDTFVRIPFVLILIGSAVVLWYKPLTLDLPLVFILTLAFCIPSVSLMAKNGQAVIYRASEGAIALLFIIGIDPLLAVVLVIAGDSVASNTPSGKKYFADWSQRTKAHTTIVASTIGGVFAVGAFMLGTYFFDSAYVPLFGFVGAMLYGIFGALPLAAVVSWVASGKPKVFISELQLIVPVSIIASALATIVSLLAIYAPLYTIAFVLIVFIPAPFVLKHVNTLQNEHYQLHNLLKISSGKKEDDEDTLTQVAATIGTMLGYRDAEIRNKPPEHGKEIGARLEDSSWLVLRNPKYRFHMMEADTKELEKYTPLILPVVESAKRRATMLQEIQTDELTKVANRKGLFDSVTSMPPGTPIAVLFFDLDKFKPVNDTYGHQAGDVALKTIASRMNEQRRGSDVVARVGGDEFVVVLANVEDESVAYSVAERIEERIHEPITIDAGVDVSIGTSYGVVLGRAEDFETLQDESDKLMYTKKRSRHNETKV